MCANFLVIVTNIVHFTDQKFIILSKIRHFLLKCDLKFILSTKYSEKICKNHFPIKFSVLTPFEGFGEFWVSISLFTEQQFGNM